VLVRHLTDTCNVMHKENAYFFNMQSKEKSELFSSFEF
jgi:hypothetical protein